MQIERFIGFISSARNLWDCVSQSWLHYDYYYLFPIINLPFFVHSTYTCHCFFCAVASSSGQVWWWWLRWWQYWRWRFFERCVRVCMSCVCVWGAEVDVGTLYMEHSPISTFCLLLDTNNNNFYSFHIIITIILQGTFAAHKTSPCVKKI